MTEYNADDIKAQTILLRDDDPSFKIICPTLGEAVIEVSNRWSKDAQGKARFKIAGKGYEYSWADIQSHLA